MGCDYTKYLSPVGQNGDRTCWAACISWWLSAQALVIKRAKKTQDELLGLFPVQGKGVTPGQLKVIGDSPIVRMEVEIWNSDLFQARSEDINVPVVIAFNYPRIGGTHANVLFNQNGRNVWAMEPYYPCPGEDGKRTGRYVQRPLSFYCSNIQIAVGRLPVTEVGITPA